MARVRCIKGIGDEGGRHYRDDGDDRSHSSMSINGRAKYVVVAASLTLISSGVLTIGPASLSSRTLPS